MELGLGLKSKCHVNQNGDGDRFVGIKADSDNVMVYFPMGYQLPDSDSEIREEILQLITVMGEFTKKQDRIIHMPKYAAPQSVDFPVNAYMDIIRSYMENRSYYKEREAVKKQSDHGNIDYAASLKRNVAFFQKDGSPFFKNFTVRGSSPNEKNLITQIHKYCVYEAFKKMGWLFMPDIPSDPHIEENHEQFLYTLRKKLSVTNNDNDKRLFNSMIAMIEFKDNPTTDRQFYFGTDRFEYVWQSLIDTAFGIKEKQEFFPRTQWLLKYAEQKNNAALEPDTIMIYDNKIYVLDAKYYRYGVSTKPEHLPESTSINKQITYAEYIYNNEKIKEKYGDDVPVYNAFLMPYDRLNNAFSSNEYFLSIGEATSDWKCNDHNFERVQGIVIDTRYLMRNYYGSQKSKIRRLANVVDQALLEADGDNEATR